MHGLGELLLTRLDPPELAEARTWYTKAAEAGNTNAMVGLGALLADWLDPPELAEARTWLQKAAEAGNTNAMVGLGIFLTDRLDPPELAEARTWYEKAADTGNTSAEYNLGMLCATQGDADGASRAWHGVIEKDQENDLVIAAALALAAVSALQGELQAARQLLDLASKRGWTSAATYATALDPNEHARANACQRLRDLAGDTDALNFLGIAAYSDREYDDARSYWTRSNDLGDGVSPLLLRLTTPSSPNESR
jgi:TPR repeat protein